MHALALMAAFLFQLAQGAPVATPSPIPTPPPCAQEPLTFTTLDGRTLRCSCDWCQEIRRGEPK